MAVCLLLAFTACGKAPEEGYTGGDTSIGGLFRDILQGKRGDSDTVRVQIRNETDAEWKDIGIAWYVNGKMIGSRGMEHAGNTLIRKDESVTFRFLPEDFPAGETGDLQIDVYIGTASGEDYISCGTVRISDPAFGDLYSYELRCEDGRYTVS